VPRVIAGTAKGRRLKTLTGDKVRPTTDRVKEALFSILGARMEGARVLDLCAGSGGLGIEALSRGGSHCTFVDTDRNACNLITENLQGTGLRDRATVLQMDAEEALERFAEGGTDGFDVILIDPPYKETALLARILTRIGAGGLLVENGTLVAEVSAQYLETKEIKGLRFLQKKKYGETGLLMYARA